MSDAEHDAWDTYDAILGIANATVTTADDDHHDLLAHAVDWLAAHREHAALYRHLLRDTDQLTLDASLTPWTW